MKHIIWATVSCAVAVVGCTSEVAPVDVKASDDPEMTALQLRAEEASSKITFGEDGRPVVPAEAVSLGSRTSEQFAKDYAMSVWRETSGSGSQITVTEDLKSTCVSTYTTETCCYAGGYPTFCCIYYSNGYGHCPV
jgi:hypothetical protein